MKMNRYLRRQTRIFTIALIVILFVTGCKFNAVSPDPVEPMVTHAFEGDVQIPAQPVHIDVSEYAMDGFRGIIAADGRDRLYLASDDVICVFAPDGSDLGKIEGVTSCLRIAANGDKLCALNRINENYILNVYDTEKRECIESYSLDIRGAIGGMFMIDGYLIMGMHNDSDSHDSVLGYRVDISSGAVDSCEYVETAEWAAKSESGILWGSVPMLLQTNWDQLPVDVPISNYAFGGCSMQDDLTVYTGINSTIGRIDWESESVISCGLAEADILFMAGGSNMLYTYNANGTVSCIPESVMLTEPEQTLHLLLPRSPVNYFLFCIQDYMREHPGIRIEYKTMDSWSIKPKLLAGSDDIDIFGMEAFYAETYAYHRAGALEDLSRYDAIRKIMEDERLIDGVFSGLIMDDELIAIPESFTTSTFMLNEGNFEKAGLSMPEPDWTWQDFFGLMQEATSDSDGDGIADGLPFMYQGNGFYSANWPLFMDDYVVNYYDSQGRTICFDTEVFRELMPLWKEFAKLDWAFERFDGVQYTWGCMNMTDMGMARMTSFGDPAGFDPYTYIQPPRIEREGEESIWIPGSNTYLLSVYSRSENKELAADFLAYMASYDQKHKYALWYDHAILYRVEDVDDYAPPMDEWERSDSEGFIEKGLPVYASVIDKTVQPILSSSDIGSFDDHISLYMIDVITLDELIARLTETAEMMLR